MKAAILKSFGSPLCIESTPDPVAGPGDIVVDVVAAGLLPYMAQVLGSERRYLLNLPVIPGPGAIGQVRALGPDSTKLQIGDWVSCDPTIRARDDALTPDITLQGLSARGPGGLRLQQHYGNGSFAEQMRVPTENAFPIGAIDEAAAGRWTALHVLMVPLGGLVASNFKPGETLLVSGATGNFGSSAVSVGLAMGARCVIAPGRDEAMLDNLVRRFGPRVKPVKLTGDDKNDTENMKAAAGSPIDVVLDIMPPTVSADVVRNAILTVREYGRVALMGGIGMLGGADLALPYPWIMRNCISIIGQWMYRREANVQLIQMVHAGLINLAHWETTDFPLNEANEAVAHAAAHGGPFKLSVIRPRAVGTDQLTDRNDFKKRVES